jgi:Na+/H+ antiporter NhaD/arsenite permease-like protein
MCVAAALVLLFKSISLKDALNAIDLNVISYLFGVFLIAEALERSHTLEYLLIRLFSLTTKKSTLLACFIGFCSLTSCLLMNDTTAIIGVPAILILCNKTKLPALPLLLALAYSATISSVMSPIGNPQNLLIANTLHEPFTTFFKALTLPTLLNLVILHVYLRICFRDAFKGNLAFKIEPIEVQGTLARLGKLSVLIMCLLIALAIICDVLDHPLKIPFGVIALCAALPIVLFSQDRLTLVKNIDWRTLFFFLGLFIFIESVWLSGYFQTLIANFNLDVTSKRVIGSLSLLLSPLISNVPLVALYLPLLEKAGQNAHLLLALCSTLAGNLVILGAASNVIIIQNCEKRALKPFSFWQFMVYGLPLTTINVLVYWLFL